MIDCKFFRKLRSLVFKINFFKNLCNFFSKKIKRIFLEQGEEEIKKNPEKVISSLLEEVKSEELEEVVNSLPEKVKDKFSEREEIANSLSDEIFREIDKIKKEADFWLVMAKKLTSPPAKKYHLLKAQEVLKKMQNLN